MHLYYCFLQIVVDIDAARLIQEQQRLEENVTQTLTRTSEESMVSAWYAHLQIMQHVFHLQAVPADVAEFNAMLTHYDTTSVRNYAAQYNVQCELLHDVAFRQMAMTFSSFYALTK